MTIKAWPQETALLNALFKRRWSAEHTLSVYRFGAEAAAIPLSDLQGMVENVAAWLTSMGLKRHDRIGILSSNRLEYVLLDLAALRLGLVTACFDPASFAQETDLAGKYGLKRLFLDTRVANPQEGADHVLPMERVLEAASADRDGDSAEPVSYVPEDVSTIKFTSGSTGIAKGLGATVGSIEQSLRSTQKLFSHGPGDTLLVFLPLSLLQQRYWIYSAILYWHDIVIADSRLALEAIQREHPTVIMGVPAFFDTLKEYIEMSAGEGSPRASAIDVLGERLRYLWTGSAAARPDTLEFFEVTCGVPIFEGYGLNETCITTKNHPGAHKRGSVGKPLDGVRVEIDAEGQIRVFRDHPVNTRYLFAPEGASEKVFMADGSVATGDLGYIDDEGFLYVMGRADDVVVLANGKTISVRPLEEAILRLPEVKQAMVFGTGRPVLASLVCPVPGADPDDVRRAVLQATRGFGSEAVELVIPVADGFSEGTGLLTSQGKLRRRAITEHYDQEIQEAYGDQS